VGDVERVAEDLAAGGGAITRPTAIGARPSLEHLCARSKRP
jgi:hypothetical protein